MKEKIYEKLLKQVEDRGIEIGMVVNTYSAAMDLYFDTVDNASMDEDVQNEWLNENVFLMDEEWSPQEIEIWNEKTAQNEE